MTALVRLAFLALLMATGLLAGSQVGAVEPTAASEHSVFAYDGDSVVAIDTTATAPRSEGLMVAQILPVEAFSAVGPVYDSSADFVAPSATRHLCSFAGDTEVLMADGTAKPISQVEVGDWVLAEDPETGERGAREVTHLWVHQDTIIDLEIDGHDVATTEDHPFWNHTDQEWQAASALDVGGLVLTADGATLTVDGMDWGSARTTTAYNLTVDDIHTYFVEVGDQAVLVHNVCLDVDALSAAGQVADRNGFTAAGRAAQKHGNRSGSFPLSTDQAARGYNEFGQDLLDDLLTAPNSAVQQYHHASFGQVTDVWGPNYGARFGPNNEFIGFLEF